MSSFRRYLDRAALPPAQDREVVDFYALPHVPDPSAHPAFKDLFEDSWSVSGREVGALDAPEPAASARGSRRNTPLRNHWHDSSFASACRDPVLVAGAQTAALLIKAMLD